MGDEQSTSSDPLEVFGLDMTASVRDQTFSWIEKVIEGRGRTPHLRQLHEEVTGSAPEGVEAARHLARWATDLCIHNFLWFFEQSERFDIVARLDSETKSIREASDGLPGELYTDDGWFARFSDYGGPVAYSETE